MRKFLVLLVVVLGLAALAGTARADGPGAVTTCTTNAVGQFIYHGNDGWHIGIQNHCPPGTKFMYEVQWSADDLSPWNDADGHWFVTSQCQNWNNGGCSFNTINPYPTCSNNDYWRINAWVTNPASHHAAEDLDTPPSVC